MLEDIQSPNDLKNLTVKELELLSSEIRERIIEVLSINGGHLGSNLGAVEFTLALHKVFDTPQDRLIFDVSHQCYPHKLITGRQDKFHLIRKDQGLCGFTHPEESPYDHFYAGHAATALSLALGVAKARDLNRTKEKVIPIIGDATLTCGMALEALNNLSSNLENFIIVLNDNKMSIADNVGCITHILDESRVSADFFEMFHLTYLGPCDGHDLSALLDIFEQAKEAKGPQVIHLVTQKGKGLQEAINNPHRYHGASPFDKVTGKFIPGPKKKNFSTIFGQHLIEMGEQDEAIVAITPATSVGAALHPFMEKFPERCIDVGIAESHALAFAGGLGYKKRAKVVVSIYATFLQRAFDNLFQDVCLQKIPVIFAIDRAYISAADGSTHHGVYDLSFLNAMPNMVITQPRNGQVLKELMESSFSYGQPTAIRYPNLPTEEVEAPLKKRPLGQGETLSEGEGLLIVSLGHMNQQALEIKELLAPYGIYPTIFDPIFVKPLDSEALFSLFASHSKVVTLEEHSKKCGLGAILNHFILENGFGHLEVKNFGVPETFLEHGSHQKILEEIGLTPQKITEEILSHFNFNTMEETVDYCLISK